MNKAGLLFAVIAGGYVLFELSMLHRLGYRMEADHILEQMASSAEAAALCGAADDSQIDTYRVKFQRLVQRALRERSEQAPQAQREQLEAGLEAELAQIRARAAQRVAADGCDSEAVSTLLRRYTIYAGKG